ncbi:uncharacterized protein LOC114540716 isoform X2 [Dendronephthya gigantea]|uniref:uncharacterized protein LOC114540716 isoform X2 n=1 Tax=Dendronephthya gigantea TaxID=151771 RepID=UPI00106B7360|nr:uncharacterized protein LOC114540716 isoform X2 [Dendronephthya gigantea]
MSVVYKVIASFEENPITRPGHNGGDGTSTSSVGTASPDIFQGDTRGPIEGIPVTSNLHSNDRQPQKILDDYKNKNPLQVKYVEGFSPHSSHSTLTGESHESARENGCRHLEGRSSGSDIEGYEGVVHDNDETQVKDDMSAFKREPARKSLKSDHLDRWINMQELYSEYKRHEPTGAPPSPVEKYTLPDSNARINRQISLTLSEPEDSEHVNVVLKPTMGENLGITVQGYKTADESELGLIVFEIDPKGCAARDGRVQVADRIVAVNNQDLTNVSNERAEEAFSKALQCDTIELSISRSHSFLPESQSFRVISGNGTSSPAESSIDRISDEDKNTLPPLPTFTSPAYKKSSQDKTDVAIPRIVEKTIVIELQKGSDGLGFSVTSRDNPAGGACPIYVKNILQYGAAIRDGQLQAGDQILEVNGTEMTGKSQEQAVNVLRSTKGQVKLLVQRKVTVTSPIGSKKLIKDLERAPSDSRGNKILTYQIPLPVSGTAGLGITVKGKSNISEQNESSGDDLGIFVKTVVPGGAAHQDGRMRPNDQLISVNGVKLTGMSNSSAMKTLRSAMEKKIVGSVEVTVIRSVQEILDNVSELETIQQKRDTSDRAIDVGRTGNERIDVPDGALADIKEIGSDCSDEKINHQETNIKENSRSKLDELKPSNYYVKPASDDELRRGVKQNNIFSDKVRHTSPQRRTVSDDEVKHRSTDRRNQNEEMKKLFAKPVLNEKTRDVISSSNRALNSNTGSKDGGISSNHHASNKDEGKLNINTPVEDEVTELRPGRGRTAKLGNGIHRNPSYYIAMNRTGQRTERLPKAKKHLSKSPFYQPKDETQNKPDSSKEEKPKIVIASITDTARVWNTTHPMVITNRPTSTVAEPTSALSTSAPATIPRSSDHSRANLSPPRESKRPPTSINIPRGTPPPPPPRTQRPSPYTKQFPNYLLATAQSPRKSDSNYSDYSDGSDVSSQSPRKNSATVSSAKVVSATEVRPENKNEKPIVSAQGSNESKIDDVIDYLTDDDEEGTGDHFVREGMGRQSMSEKRFKLAQADITQTEFYKQRVTRSRSLEGAIKENNDPVALQTKTLPRPSTTPIEKSRRRKSDDSNERLIDFNPPIPKERSKKNDKESLTLGSFDPNSVRGQWRTSSDGVVKKYGRHGNYVKASPLASMPNNNFESSVHPDGSQVNSEDAIPITMQSNADYNLVHPKVKKKSSGFNLKNLGAALKPKAYKGKYDMQSRQAPESPSEPPVDMDEQRYRQLVLGEPRERSLSETLYTRYVSVNDSPESTRSRRKKSEQAERKKSERPSPTSLQDILKKGSGEYSITESAQI